MCELLGMSASEPTDILFSFKGLAKRGGDTAPHKDGWGVSFYEGRRCRSFHDTTPCCDSSLAKFLSEHAIRSEITIAHIRLATHGSVTLANTHPFIRTAGSRSWSFAHNGKLPTVKKWALENTLPVGTTDSEHAFCWLMEQIQKKYPKLSKVRPQTFFRYLNRLLWKMHCEGSANLLLSDSRYLIAYCSTKLQLFTKTTEQNAHDMLSGADCVDIRDNDKQNPTISVLSTEALTDDSRWVAIEPGTMVVLRSGELVYQHQGKL